MTDDGHTNQTMEDAAVVVDMLTEIEGPCQGGVEAVVTGWIDEHRLHEESGVVVAVAVLQLADLDPLFIEDDLVLLLTLLVVVEDLHLTAEVVPIPLTDVEPEVDDLLPDLIPLPDRPIQDRALRRIPLVALEAAVAVIEVAAATVVVVVDLLALHPAGNCNNYQSFKGE